GLATRWRTSAYVPHSIFKAPTSLQRGPAQRSWHTFAGGGLVRVWADFRRHTGLLYDCQEHRRQHFRDGVLRHHPAARRSTDQPRRRRNPSRDQHKRARYLQRADEPVGHAVRFRTEALRRLFLSFRWFGFSGSWQLYLAWKHSNE